MGTMELAHPNPHVEAIRRRLRVSDDTRCRRLGSRVGVEERGFTTGPTQIALKRQIWRLGREICFFLPAAQNVLRAFARFDSKLEGQMTTRRLTTEHLVNQENHYQTRISTTRT